MAHNTHSNKKKEKINKESQKEEKNKKTLIGLHQATYNYCIMHILFCISNIYMHPFNSVSHINEFLNQIEICLDQSINNR